MLLLALVTSCRAGGGDDVPEGPPRDLAAVPSSLAPSAPVPGGTPTSGSTAPSPGASRPSVPAAGSGSSGSSAPGRPTAGPPGATAAPPGPFTTIGRVEDPAGDTEGSGPGYADLRGVEIGDDGRNVRFTLVVAGPLPARVAQDETFGAGIDLFRSLTQVESDYQVFVDGSPDGWFAYLHGPDGYVRYPGTFALGGTRLEFTLPWTAVGNRRTGRFSAFADWARQATGANPFSEDHAPDIATVSYG